MISCCFTMPALEGAITSGRDRSCASSSLQIASDFNCNAHYHFTSVQCFKIRNRFPDCPHAAARITGIPERPGPPFSLLTLFAPVIFNDVYRAGNFPGANPDTAHVRCRRDATASENPTAETRPRRQQADNADDADDIFYSFSDAIADVERECSSLSGGDRPDILDVVGLSTTNISDANSLSPGVLDVVNEASSSRTWRTGGIADSPRPPRAIRMRGLHQHQAATLRQQ